MRRSGVVLALWWTCACGGGSTDREVDPAEPPIDASPGDTLTDAVGHTPDSPGHDAVATDHSNRYDCNASCTSREELCGALVGFDCVGFCEAAIQIGLDASCPDKAEAWVVCTHTMCDLTACSSLGATFASECAAPYCTMNFTPSCDMLD